MQKLFSFKHGGEGKRLKLPSTRAPKLKDESANGPFYIRGIKAGSKDEYWVYLALEIICKKTGWTYEYQYPVYGGRRRRGGNVIDFLVKTPGRWTILDPMGRVWHTGKREDRYQMKNVAREKNWNLIAWFTDQTPTKESVLSFLRKEFHI
jgi:hypothetical protein